MPILRHFSKGWLQKKKFTIKPFKSIVLLNTLFDIRY